MSEKFEVRPKRKDFKLTEADIERELYEDFKLVKLNLGLQKHMPAWKSSTFPQS